MPGLPLSLYEREEIGVMLIRERDVGWAVIARRVGRHATTIAREVTGRGGRDGYRPALAQQAAQTALARPRCPMLAQPTTVSARVAEELKAGRSPYAIWADLDAEQVAGRPCVETIYTAVYNGTMGVKARECLRTRRPRRRSRQDRHPNKRAGLPNIGSRPDSVNDRTEPGHWEVDQIIGKANGSSMIWLTERVTKYSIPIVMPCGYTAEQVLAGLVEACEQIPAHLRRSFTFDQGSEWAEWELLAVTYQLDCWFCDPHSPWQRGQIEHHNRQVRFWFPRGTRLDIINQHDANQVAGLLNGQRRRSLNAHSPTMLYAAASTTVQ